MTLAEHVETSSRWQRTLHAPETLDDDLGTIGMWLGPRTGPFKRAQGEKEDYALRRLLVAWKQAGALRFPVEASAGKDAGDEPDFVLTWDDGTVRGVEVTEAGKEDYQAWLTRVEPDLGRGRAVHVPFAGSLDATVEDFRTAIARKIDKFDRDAYHVSGGCDLVVYDNTCWGGFDDKREILDALGRPKDLSGRFRNVHVIFTREVWLDIFGERRAVDVSQAYEVDFVLWLFAQAEYLRRGAFDRLDIGYLAEELESLGRANKNALGNHMKNLMWHLLKWQFQPERRSQSWSLTIENARDEIYRLLTENPSLRNEFVKRLEIEYSRARRAAAIETELPRARFPEECPYTAEQLVNPEYLPD